MKSRETVVIETDKIINRIIHLSKKFVEETAFPYGLLEYLKTEESYGELSYDFEYFVFTKSTKSLLSIRNLLKENHNEDIFILLRSVFEGYLATRYFNSNSEKINDFIFNPKMLDLALYNVSGDGQGNIKNESKEVIGKIINPTSFKMGKDKRYYYDFYAFLNKFSHCNFGIVNLYFSDQGLFDYQRENYVVEVRLFTIFVYTKLIEHIATVEGEEFKDDKTEKEYYLFVEESIEYQKNLFDLLIESYKSMKDKKLEKKNKRMCEMLKSMKNSLNEEIGSLKK